MKPNNGKKTKLILTILICALITVGVTVGIGCYNYYGYDKYKTDFLDEFFALDSSMSNQDKIEHAVKWDYNDYIKHPGKLTFYDPGDFSKIPEGAVLRTKRAGDMFTKFGGGTKKLKDYLIDKKIPKRNRDKLLLIAKDEKILIICGIEISDLIRVDKSTSNVLQCYISDNLNKG